MPVDVSALTDELRRLLHELREADPAAERNEALAREIGRAEALLEIREAEVRRLARREEALAAEVQYWIEHTGKTALQLEQREPVHEKLREEINDLREEAARLTAAEKKHAAEKSLLDDRINTSAWESVVLRRLIAEIQSSLSWRITAPLRAAAKPLFARRAAKMPEAVAATGVTRVLAELGRARSVVLIPSAIPFNATLNQRPIACARYLAEQGATVLFAAWQWNPEEPVPQAWEEVAPRIFQVPLYGFLNAIGRIAAASSARGTYLCTIPSAELSDIVGPLRAAGYHIHYDIMDDWEEFHQGGEAPWFAGELEREVILTADTVSAVSDRLAAKFSHLRGDIAVVRNGYRPAALACEEFANARTAPAGPRTIGYFGHLSEAWFDWDAVFEAAARLPATCFEIIGWGPAERTTARMKEFPNIRFIGVVPQAELHTYVRKWWGAMIPFRPSPVSAAVDPLKIYEYLHFGLATVVTGITGIAQYPLVRYAQDHEAFVAAVETLARPAEEDLPEVARFLKDCVWEARFGQLMSLMAASRGVSAVYAR